MLKFHIYDVFTDKPFTGNPLAVVEGADGLSTAQMQTLARQFNLSETIFIQTPDDPINTAKVRIFFPTAEIPFAGHPTIGCAIHLAQGTATDIRLEEVAGLVPVCLDHGANSTVAEFTAPKRPTAKPAPAPDALASALAAALGLSASDLGPHAPGHFEGGPSFLYLHLKDLDALARAKVNSTALDALVEMTGTMAIYAYTQTGPNALQARMLDPLAGIPEDPATGSATAILSGQLNANGLLPQNGTTKFTLAQGVEMGRPSKLELTIDTQDHTLTEIRVAGGAVKVAEGQITPPAP